MQVFCNMYFSSFCEDFLDVTTAYSFVFIVYVLYQLQSSIKFDMRVFLWYISTFYRHYLQGKS